MKNENVSRSTTNGGSIGTEAPAKKGWFASLPESSQELLVGVAAVTVAVGAFIGFCVAAGAVSSASDRKKIETTLNSEGFKAMLERGILDPIPATPPARTLEEAAARIIEKNADREQLVFLDDPYLMH